MKKDTGDSRNGSGLQKVSGSTGRSLTSRGQGETSRCKKVVVKSEPGGARSKSKLMEDRKEEKKEFNKSKRRKTVKLETPVVVKKEKLTDNEEESKSEKLKKSDKKSVKKVKNELFSDEEDSDNTKDDRHLDKKKR